MAGIAVTTNTPAPAAPQRAHNAINQYHLPTRMQPAAPAAPTPQSQIVNAATGAVVQHVLMPAVKRYGPGLVNSAVSQIGRPSSRQLPEQRPPPKGPIPPVPTDNPSLVPQPPQAQPVQQAQPPAQTIPKRPPRKNPISGVPADKPAVPSEPAAIVPAQQAPTTSGMSSQRPPQKEPIAPDYAYAPSAGSRSSGRPATGEASSTSKVPPPRSPRKGPVPRVGQDTSAVASRVVGPQSDQNAQSVSAAAGQTSGQSNILLSAVQSFSTDESLKASYDKIDPVDALDVFASIVGEGLAQDNATSISRNDLHPKERANLNPGTSREGFEAVLPYSSTTPCNSSIRIRR